MKFFKKLKKINKTILTIFLSSNLILLSTSSAELNESSQSATESSKATGSAQVLGESSPSASPSPNLRGGKYLPTSTKIDPSGRFFEDQLTIIFKENLSSEVQNDILSANGNLKSVWETPNSKVKLLEVDPSLQKQMIQALGNNPNVEYVGPNYVARGQDGFGGGGGIFTTSGTCWPNDDYYCLGYQ